MYPIYFKYFMILEFLIQTLESGICCLQRTCSNFSLVDGGFVKCVCDVKRRDVSAFLGSNVPLLKI